jgi:phage shock protein E
VVSAAVRSLAGTAIALCLVVVLTGCAKQSTPGTSAPTVEQTAWAEIAKGAAVIDVRTPQEYDQGHLAMAVNIPYDEIGSRKQELPADKSRAIVLYCERGVRSGIAKRTLEGLGYTHTINGGGYEPLMRARPD